MVNQQAFLHFLCLCSILCAAQPSSCQGETEISCSAKQAVIENVLSTEGTALELLQKRALMEPEAKAAISDNLKEEGRYIYRLETNTGLEHLEGGYSLLAKGKWCDSLGGAVEDKNGVRGYDHTLESCRDACASSSSCSSFSYDQYFNFCTTYAKCGTPTGTPVEVEPGDVLPNIKGWLTFQKAGFAAIEASSDLTEAAGKPHTFLHSLLGHSLIFCVVPGVVALLTLIMIVTRPSTTPHRKLTITPTTVFQWFIYIIITTATAWFMLWFSARFLPLDDGSTFFLVMFGFETFRHVVNNLPFSLMAFVPWPDQEKENMAWKNDPEFLKQIAVVIPCHKCADEIKPALESYLKYFEPEQIVFCDNANTVEPPDNLRETLKEINPKVNYVYIPEGLKSQALHVGVESMARFKYVLLVDDDTQLEEDMVFDESHFLENPKMAGVGWTRHILSHNMVTDCVKFQLKAKSGQLRGQMMYALSGTNYFLVGVCALYRRDIWLDIMKKHPCTPYGEDMFSGSLALTMGYQLATEQRNCAMTYSPPVITGMCSRFNREQGYGAATLWKQRALRWNCTGMRNMPFMIRHFFFQQCGDWRSNFFFRWMLLRWFCQKMTVFLRPWIFMVMVICPERIFMLFPFHLLAVYVEALTMDLCINYIFWWGQKKHQVPFMTMICTAFMDMLLAIFTTVGSIKCLTCDIWHPTYRWRVGTWKKFKHLYAQPAGEENLHKMMPNISKLK